MVKRPANDAASQLRRGFCRAGLPCGCVWGLAGGICLSSVAVCALRLMRVGVPWWMGPGAAALGASIGALVALRRVPSRAACRALADDLTHAGGLILVSDLPGADRWPVVGRVAPRPPRPSLKLPLLALGVTLALFLVAAFVPLPRASAPSAPVVPVALIDAAEAEIERLAEEAELSPEELEEVREEVKRIVEAAPGASAAETVDALSRVADRLRYGEALAREEARRATEPRNAFSSAADAAALNQELSDMLAQSPSSEDVTENGAGEGEGEGEGGSSARGEGEGEGEGQNPGNGGASRGEGAAIISWTDPVAMGASKLKDIAREADPTKDESVRIGEAADEWDTSAAAAPRGAATGLTAPRTTGAGTVPARILPRHRDAVRRYFSTGKEQAK